MRRDTLLSRKFKKMVHVTGDAYNVKRLASFVMSLEVVKCTSLRQITTWGNPRHFTEILERKKKIVTCCRQPFLSHRTQCQ